ncbi:nuclease-related domain-containing protein [Streptomyces sp. NPDC092296]|uniref:nuclease-related domain-containing protein n=1 Tax=Streptomyces sp. NPDC092296 TaxID=3366012 RepID=UPI00382E5032
MAVPVGRGRKAGAGASAARRGRQQRAAEVARQHRLGRWVLPGAALPTLGVGLWAASVGGAAWFGAVVALSLFVRVVWLVYRPGRNSWRVGATGERRTARLLAPLERRGWVLLHDRSIPGSRANLDHLVLGPPGVVYVDTKLWASEKSRLQLRDGTLWYGRYPQDRALRTVEWEAGLAAVALGVPVRAVVAVHGAAVPGGVLRLGDVMVLPAKQLRRYLRDLQPERGMDDARLRQLAARAAVAFPPYRP